MTYVRSPLTPDASPEGAAPAGHGRPAIDPEAR